MEPRPLSRRATALTAENYRDIRNRYTPDHLGVSAICREYKIGKLRLYAIWRGDERYHLDGDDLPRVNLMAPRPPPMPNFGGNPAVARPREPLVEDIPEVEPLVEGIPEVEPRVEEIAEAEPLVEDIPEAELVVVDDPEPVVDNPEPVNGPEPVVDSPVPAAPLAPVVDWSDEEFALTSSDEEDVAGGAEEGDSDTEEIAEKEAAMLKVDRWSGFTDLEREMALEDEARRVAGGDPLMGEIVPWAPPAPTVEGGYESDSSYEPEPCDECGRVGCTGDVVEGGAETNRPDPPEGDMDVISDHRESPVGESVSDTEPLPVTGGSVADFIAGLPAFEWKYDPLYDWDYPVPKE